MMLYLWRLKRETHTKAGCHWQQGIGRYADDAMKKAPPISLHPHLYHYLFHWRLQFPTSIITYFTSEKVCTRLLILTDTLVHPVLNWGPPTYIYGVAIIAAILGG